jgi:ferredoxin-thioredoxin reductase catalytic subunit
MKGIVRSIIGSWSCLVFIFQLSLLLQPAHVARSHSYAFVPIQIAPRTRQTGCHARPCAVALRNKASDLSEEEYEAKMEKATKAMTAFTNKYLQNTCTTLCTDKSVPAVVIKGLAEHKVTLGTPLCPCRFYENKEAEAKDGFWNCPCVPMRERHECHCMLFLTEDNAFAGEEQVRPTLSV